LGLDIEIDELEILLKIETIWQTLIEAEAKSSNLLQREMQILHNMLQRVDINLELLSNFITKRFYINREPKEIKEFLVAIKKDTVVGFIIKNIRR